MLRTARTFILIAGISFTASSATASTTARDHLCHGRHISGIKVFRMSTTATCATVSGLARDWLEASAWCVDRGCYLAPDRARWRCRIVRAGRGPQGAERNDVRCLTSPGHQRSARFSYYSGGADY